VFNGPVADVRPSKGTPSSRLQDRLEAAARAAPSGGRAKWIVWAVLGGIVVVIGVLQMLRVIPLPFEDRLRKEHEKPVTAPEAPKDGQGTTR
jgi:hypothetical protein